MTIQNLLAELRPRFRGVKAVAVAMLDGALDIGHPALVGAGIVERCALGEAVQQPSAHGTHVAGILFGQTEDVPGIVPGCRAISVPIWPSQGRVCTQADLAQSIELALKLGANVINISGGELSPEKEIDAALAQAVERCVEQRVLVVAAVGNEGCLCPHVPAILPGVLAVGAMDGEGAVSPFSNWSEAYARSGLIAPGEALTTARVGGGSVQVHGTSYAAAVVSGVAAWLMSVQVELGGRADGTAIRESLLETAMPCDPKQEQQCERVLAGRMDVRAALERILQEAAQQVKVAGLEVAEAMGQQTGSKDAFAEGVLETGEAAAGVGPSEGVVREDAFEEREKEERVMAVTQEETRIDEGMAEAPVYGARSEYAPAGVAASGIDPSACGCGCDKDAALAYVVGTIGYDFGSRAKYDSFAAEMSPGGAPVNPYDPSAMAAYLQQNPFAAPDLVWTLNVESIPVYSLAPTGPYSAKGYELLVQLLAKQGALGSAQLVSVPGRLKGSAQLQNGQTIPVLIPVLRGIFSWTLDTMLATAMAKVDGKEADARKVQYTNFFQRFFYELRNMGRTPSERAINFGGTSIFQMGDVFASKIEDELVLHRIEVSKSLVCPPGGDCWDVSLIFFHPRQMLDRAREVLRFTVDVSHEMPVRVGAVNSWSTYGGIG